MESKIVLTKESGMEEVKRYFTAVLDLAKTSEEFPVNLDEVWMLVYGKKSDAVVALRRDFLQDVDYQVLRNNPQNLQGGRPTEDYYLTVSCLEFFIARKVRAVFEVYRQVFHHVSQGVTSQSSLLEDKLKVIEFSAKFLNLNEASKLMMLKAVADPLGLPTPDYVDDKGTFHSASELLKEHGVEISAQAFNKLLEKEGLLQTLYRNSSKGKKKPYKNITKKGMAYGENKRNPNNQSETQPVWYDDRFGEVLEIVGLV